MMHLPIADEQIALDAWRQTTIWSTTWIYVAGCAFGVAAWRQGVLLLDWALAALCCVGHWLLVSAAGTVLAARRPRPDYPKLSLILFALPFAIVMLGKAGVDAAVPLFGIATPGGWVSGVWQYGWLRGETLAWIGVVPVVALVIAGLGARRALPSRYVAAEPAPPSNTAPLRPPVAPSRTQLARRWFAAWGRWRRGDFVLRETDPLTCDEARKRIRTREFLGPPGWPRTGPLDRIAERLLTSRERLIVELLSASGLRAANASRWLLRSVVVIAAFELLWPGGLRDASGLILVTALALLVPAPWDGRWALILLPDLAAFPLAPGELASIGFKIAVVRLPLHLAVATFCVAVVSRPLVNPAQMFLNAIWLACWSLAIESARAAWALMTRWKLTRLRWKIAFWLVVVGLFWPAITFSGVALHLLSAGAPPLPWAAIAFWAILVVFLSMAGLRFCLFIYRAGHCDVRPAPRVTLAHLYAVPIMRWKMQRRRRLALRRQYGLFWWLPRHMTAARAEEAAP